MSSDCGLYRVKPKRSWCIFALKWRENVNAHVSFSTKVLIADTIFMPSESWFSLAHKDKDVRKRRMVYLTQFSKPALLNPMINKMADKAYAILFLMIWVRMRSRSKWPMIGPRPCAYACAYVDLDLTSRSYNISVSTSTRRTNLSVFSCAYVYAYVAGVFTCLHMCLCLWLCWCLCASENQV